MREILETMLRDIEKETAPMRVLYEAQTKERIKEIDRERRRHRRQKKMRMNPHSTGFPGGKPIANLSFSILVNYWYHGQGTPGINRVFPINTEGYLK
ncbi:MAG: hypothetical protein JRM77_06870 [Nitrososphaerota archaeon]|nr:hypothetical protein [Nitrososphaerota archaeon]